MVEPSIAVIILVACALGLARLLLPPRWRGAIARAARHGRRTTLRVAARAWRRPLARRRAARAADEAIRRARGRDGPRDGGAQRPPPSRDRERH